MMISELLWVGEGPEGRSAVPCHEPQEAARLVRQDIRVVVPNTDIAHQTLLVLGSSNKWANYATGRARPSDYNFGVELM